MKLPNPEYENNEKNKEAAANKNPISLLA